MIPVSQATVIAFLEWVRQKHPEVHSLKSFAQFIPLIEDYEQAEGVHLSALAWEWIYSSINGSDLQTELE
jgi:hypothetical protein